MEFNFGLGAVAVEMSPGILPEIESADQPNGECDLLNPGLLDLSIHCTDNAERSCGSPATGGTYT